MSKRRVSAHFFRVLHGIDIHLWLSFALVLAADENEDKDLAEHSCSAQLCID